MDAGWLVTESSVAGVLVLNPQEGAQTSEELHKEQLQISRDSNTAQVKFSQAHEKDNFCPWQMPTLKQNPAAMKTNQSKKKSSSRNRITESSRKKRKTTTGSSSSDRRDRISELPDEILHHILSFLTTKSAMKTSVLSKRWRRVWACCPVLRLDQREFSSASKFASFVEGVRSLHGGLSLQRLVLSWQQGFDVLKVEALVKHAMMRHLKEIWVESPAGRGGRALPGFLFHGGARVFIYSSLST